MTNMAIHGTTIEKEFGRASAPILTVTLAQGELSESTCALVDTGCEGYAFIDLEFAQKKGIKLTPLRRPFSLYGYDGAGQTPAM